ncbi:MAG: TIGR04086 family membrane protein [Ruminiclostridium sp.]|nr:TIGR04086 family membrane protein [Ruminiclostridium sp.]
MSVNKKVNENIKKAAAYAFSALCGAAASTVLIILFSGLMYALGLPPGLAGALSLTAFGAGCAVCGFVCGSIKKRGGLRVGIICAAVMTACVLVCSLVFGELSGGALAAKLLTAALCACTGAVLAVNRRE